MSFSAPKKKKTPQEKVEKNVVLTPVSLPGPETDQHLHQRPVVAEDGHVQRGQSVVVQTGTEHTPVTTPS
jgi:hypothetical protein